MLTPSGLLVGFAYKAFAADETTLYVVNVCGHDSVGLPLARSMNAVDDSYIEHNGVDNLMIPIAVSAPKPTTKGECAFCVDVVVHTVLIKKCVFGHHLYQHLTEKLLALSIEWVQNECGVKLLRKSCVFLGNPYYFADVKDGKSLENVMKMAAELLKAEESRGRENNQESSPPLAAALELKNSELKECKKPLIQEVITTPGIRKGFLNSGSARLYGPEGSSEGTGKTHDPLAHIPKSLRDKCRVVDTRNLMQSTGQPVKSQVVPSSTSALRTGEVDKERVAEYGNVPNSQWRCASFEQTDKTLVVRFAVPDGIASLRDVDLSATASTLEINGVVTQLPLSIATDGVRAKFVKTNRVLVVTCPIDV